MLDASRAVNTVASLLDPKQRPDVRQRKPQRAGAAAHAARALARAQAAAHRRGARASPQARLRTCPDRQAVVLWALACIDDQPLDELEPYIDWRFFFSAWELKGDVPAIFDDPKQGEAARDLYDNAQCAARPHHDEKSCCARAACTASGRHSPRATTSCSTAPKICARRSRAFPCCASRTTAARASTPRSLADFVAPKESGVVDYVGAFAVTAGLGVDELAKQFEREHDDYSAIIVKALADRLAEAFAEYSARARRARTAATAQSEKLSQADSGRREVPRHPPRVRLSRLPRPHRQTHAVRAARRAQGRASS